MHVYLDDQPIRPESPTLAAAIELARRTALEQGRVIIEVKGDGVPIAGDVLENPPEADAGIGELRMISTPPGPMAREILLEAVDTIEAARLDQARSAQLVQSGSVAEALEPMQNALEAWSLVRDVVDKIQSLVGLDAPATRIEVRGASLTGQACVVSLSETLADLRTAVQTSDWAALGDVLAYDLDEQADRWTALLRALANAASEISLPEA